MKADQWDAYIQHLIDGGAPFGGKFDANIREAIEGYQEAIGILLRRQRKPSRSDTDTTAPDQDH
jgi:hypothetical protein